MEVTLDNYKTVRYRPVSYATDTILVRDNVKGDRFDRLKVIGPSPIKSSAIGEWGGGAGESVIVQPIGTDEFGGPEILPLRAAAEQYTIEFEPSPAPTHVQNAEHPRAVRQLTPEEQFRAESRQPVAPEKSKRVRTPIVAAD